MKFKKKATSFNEPSTQIPILLKAKKYHKYQFLITLCLRLKKLPSSTKNTIHSESIFLIKN